MKSCVTPEKLFPLHFRVRHQGSTRVLCATAVAGSHGQLLNLATVSRSELTDLTSFSQVVMEIIYQVQKLAFDSVSKDPAPWSGHFTLRELMAKL